VIKYHEPNIKVLRSEEVKVPLKSIRCPQLDLPLNFRYNPSAPREAIYITRTNLWRAAIIWRAKNDPLKTLCVLTSPLLEEFPVLALLESARVILGSSKVPFEF